MLYRLEDLFGVHLSKGDVILYRRKAGHHSQN